MRENSARPVVLVSGAELEQALRWGGDFLDLLRRKANALLVHRQVLLDVAVRRSGSGALVQSDPSRLPAANRIFVLLDGSRSRWLQCEGSFGRFTFVHEVQDIDWVPGAGVGVTLDIGLPLQEQKDVVELLHQMARMGWVTRKGCWSIQQAGAVWHGFGADALVEALGGWRRRYEGLETHHTEELVYADECGDGFYTLVAQFSADRRRVVWEVEISFQLRGIPLDPSPYRELCDHFGLGEPVYFRPRSENSRTWGRAPSKRPVVKPLAYVVEVEGLMGDDEEEWVAGIVVQNPFFEGRTRSRPSPTWVPDLVEWSEYLLCALRSWHVLENPKSVYELWDFESAWTSDGLVVRAVADWQSEPDDDVPSSTLDIAEAPKRAPRARRKSPAA